MVKFLDTQGISAELSQIIKNADERLVIISPYLKVNPRIQELLVHTDVDVLVVCRKERIQAEEQWLESLNSVKVCYHKDLHAKCYLNEKQAILTSMNLYQFSQENNLEMGLLVSRQGQEIQLYEDVRKEADRIARMSQVILEVAKSKPSGGELDDDLSIPWPGSCIRCKADIETDPEFPYCWDCFESWSRWQNENYPEKYCHICGNQHTATMAKPFCVSCYRKYNDFFEEVNFLTAETAAYFAEHPPIGATPRKPEPSIGIPASGYCIRDKTVIPLEPLKPYCSRCFAEWNKYGNTEYGESYCHICGGFNTSTIRKPLCLGCYRIYQGEFFFYSYFFS